MALLLPPLESLANNVYWQPLARPQEDVENPRMLWPSFWTGSPPPSPDASCSVTWPETPSGSVPLGGDASFMLGLHLLPVILQGPLPPLIMATQVGKPYLFPKLLADMKTSMTEYFCMTFARQRITPFSWTCSSQTVLIAGEKDSTLGKSRLSTLGRWGPRSSASLTHWDLNAFNPWFSTLTAHQHHLRSVSKLLLLGVT